MSALHGHDHPDHPDLSVDLYDGLPRLHDFEIAARLPRLTDDEVACATSMAEAYEYARSCSLALSGIVLLQHFEIASLDSLAGVVATVRTDLGRARSAAQIALRSRRDQIRSRAAVLLDAVAILDAEVRGIARGLRSEPSLEALRRVNALLKRCDSLEVNMLHVGSLSCAADTGAMSTSSDEFKLAASGQHITIRPDLVTIER